MTPPGKYLFCCDDLAKDHETDEAREKEVDKLVRKKLSQSLNPKVRMVTKL